MATVALTLTGLSEDSARFQARSAYLGVGFTTSEAEQVVGHPVRRRILMVLMLLGNVGIVTVLASLVLSFLVATQEGGWLWRVVLMTVGLGMLVLVFRSEWVDRRLCTLIRWALEKWSDLDVRDYANLFKLSDGYAVSEMMIEPTDWMADKSLEEAALAAEGVLVLGVHREDGTYIGAPRGSTRIRPNDRLVLYGRAQHLGELDGRGKGTEGEEAHRSAVDEQERILAAQSAKGA